MDYRRVCGDSGVKGGLCGVSDVLKESYVGFKEVSGVMLGYRGLCGVSEG